MIYSSAPFMAHRTRYAMGERPADLRAHRWPLGEFAELRSGVGWDDIVGPPVRRLRSALLAWVAVAVAGCVSTSIDITFAPGAIQLQGAGSTYLHRPSERPIHVGDGRGDVADVPTEFRLANPPRGYGWKFRLDRPPSSAEMELVLQGVAPATDPAGCRSQALLNGHPVAELNGLVSPGPAVSSVVTVPLAPEALRVGENVLELTQTACARPPAGDRFDDFLIRSVAIRVS